MTLTIGTVRLTLAVILAIVSVIMWVRKSGDASLFALWAIFCAVYPL